MKDFKNRPTFSKNLIRFRKAKKLSQLDLANLTGLSKRVIAHYETKVVKPPVDKIQVLAKALNVSINDLLGNQEPTELQKEFIDIDSRTLKKLQKILSLTPEERHIVYTFVDSLLLKRKMSNKK